MCERRSVSPGNPIVAVVAETREQARAAAAAVKVEYEPLPVQMTVEESLSPDAYPIHEHAPDNICATQPIIKGDADKAFAEAYAVVEAEFSTQTNHQAPLEPEVSSAYFEGDELVVVGRSINIHFHCNQLKEAVGYDKIRYKEAFRRTIRDQVWIITSHCRGGRSFRRLSVLYGESMLITTKRHAYPSIKMKRCDEGASRLV